METISPKGRFLKKVSKSDDWPMPRMVMERPERFRYVHRKKSSTGCVFCSAAQKRPSFKTLVLLRTELCLVVLNKFPYNTGHLLILPRRHCPSLVELTPDENMELAEMIQKVAGYLERAYRCQGINFGLNHGAAAGAGLPSHLHWHAVPRWFGDTNFFPVLAQTKVLPETLEQSYLRLLPFFKGP